MTKALYITIHCVLATVTMASGVLMALRARGEFATLNVLVGLLLVAAGTTLVFHAAIAVNSEKSL